ncbi:unnamed protein product [Ilex paraguariensis]|uniref:Uncharacterized protein n=1 Tax=Ilex paraguariensis TaxID=185542 RepID=A0ABC8QZG6_9AQUA
MGTTSPSAESCSMITPVSIGKSDSVVSKNPSTDSRINSDRMAFIAIPNGSNIITSLKRPCSQDDSCNKEADGLGNGKLRGSSPNKDSSCSEDVKLQMNNGTVKAQKDLAKGSPCNVRQNASGVSDGPSQNYVKVCPPNHIIRTIEGVVRKKGSETHAPEAKNGPSGEHLPQGTCELSRDRRDVTPNLIVPVMEANLSSQST